MRTSRSGLMTNFLNDKALGVEGLDVLENRNLAQAGYEVIGRLSEQLVHDIRSPLSAIKMLVRAEDLQASKEMLLMCVKRVEEIIEKFRASCLEKITGRDALESVNMNEALEWIVAEKRTEFLGRVEIVLAESSDQVTARAKRGDLKTVLSNIINNGIESYHGADIATLPRIDIRMVERGQHVEIEVRDYGCGIPSDLLRQIGRRGLSFGKDKLSSSGSGLGLHSAIETVKAWGGDLHIHSEVGQGTSVLLRFKK